LKYLIFALILILLFPLYWMIIGSIQPSAGVMKLPPNWIPRNITLVNFAYIVKETMIFRWTFNTIMLNTISLCIQLFCLVTAGYAFAAYKFVGKQVIYWIFVASLIIPWQGLLVSRYILMRHLYLLNTWFAIIALNAFAPISFVFIRNYFEKIPTSMIDSARIDGAREIRILFQIILPQCKPILGYLALHSYLTAFQDFFWPMLVLNDKRLFTLPLGIVHFLKTFTSTHGLLMHQQLLGYELAGGVLLLLPAIIIFVIFRKTFRQQFLAGGIKA